MLKGLRSTENFGLKGLKCFLILAVTITTWNISSNTWAAVGTTVLPMPGQMISTTPAYQPMVIQGVTVDPDNPFHFNFLINQGQGEGEYDELKAEAERLVKYFLAGLTVPENELWVNLSPYEEDRVIADKFSQTDMGRDLLVQDYILKQMASSLMHPDSQLGEAFWDRVYSKVDKTMRLSDMPVNMFSKVWIVPEKAEIYVKDHNALIVKSGLKVMLEEDYVALANSLSGEVPTSATQSATDRNPQGHLQMTAQAIKDIIIPELEVEINQGQMFAPLRQIYHSMILASWFKRNLKNSLLSKMYVGQNKIEGIDHDDVTIKDEVYQTYLEAYQKGVFDLIREDYDPQTQSVVARKYFSGGIPFTHMNIGNAITVTNNSRAAQSIILQNQLTQTGVVLMPNNTATELNSFQITGGRVQPENLLISTSVIEESKTTSNLTQLTQTGVVLMPNNTATELNSFQITGGRVQPENLLISTSVIEESKTTSNLTMTIAPARDLIEKSFIGKIIKDIASLVLGVLLPLFLLGMPVLAQVIGSNYSLQLVKSYSNQPTEQVSFQPQLLRTYEYKVEYGDTFGDIVQEIFEQNGIQLTTSELWEMGIVDTLMASTSGRDVNGDSTIGVDANGNINRGDTLLINVNNEVFARVAQALSTQNAQVLEQRLNSEFADFLIKHQGIQGNSTILTQSAKLKFVRGLLENPTTIENSVIAKELAVSEQIQLYDVNLLTEAQLSASALEEIESKKDQEFSQRLIKEGVDESSEIIRNKAKLRYVRWLVKQEEIQGFNKKERPLTPDEEVQLYKFELLDEDKISPEAQALMNAENDPQNEIFTKVQRFLEDNVVAIISVLVSIVGLTFWARKKSVQKGNITKPESGNSDNISLFSSLTDNYLPTTPNYRNKGNIDETVNTLQLIDVVASRNQKTTNSSASRVNESQSNSNITPTAKETLPVVRNSKPPSASNAEVDLTLVGIESLSKGVENPFLITSSNEQSVDSIMSFDVNLLSGWPLHLLNALRILLGSLIVIGAVVSIVFAPIALSGIPIWLWIGSAVMTVAAPRILLPMIIRFHEYSHLIAATILYLPRVISDKDFRKNIWSRDNLAMNVSPQTIRDLGSFWKEDIAEAPQVRTNTSGWRDRMIKISGFLSLFLLQGLVLGGLILLEVAVPTISLIMVPVVLTHLVPLIWSFQSDIWSNSEEGCHNCGNFAIAWNASYFYLEEFHGENESAKIESLERLYRSLLYSVKGTTTDDSFADKNRDDVLQTFNESLLPFQLLAKWIKAKKRLSDDIKKTLITLQKHHNTEDGFIEPGAFFSTLLNQDELSAKLKLDNDLGRKLRRQIIDQHLSGWHKKVFRPRYFIDQNFLQYPEWVRMGLLELTHILRSRGGQSIGVTINAENEAGLIVPIYLKVAQDKRGKLFNVNIFDQYENILLDAKKIKKYKPLIGPNALRGHVRFSTFGKVEIHASHPFLSPIETITKVFDFVNGQARVTTKNLFADITTNGDNDYYRSPWGTLDLEEMKQLFSGMVFRQNAPEGPLPTGDSPVLTDIAHAHFNQGHWWGAVRYAYTFVINRSFDEAVSTLLTKDELTVLETFFWNIFGDVDNKTSWAYVLSRPEIKPSNKILSDLWVTAEDAFQDPTLTVQYYALKKFQQHVKEQILNEMRSNSKVGKIFKQWKSRESYTDGNIDTIIKSFSEEEFDQALDRFLETSFEMFFDGSQHKFMIDFFSKTIGTHGYTVRSSLEPNHIGLLKDRQGLTYAWKIVKENMAKTMVGYASSIYALLGTWKESRFAFSRTLSTGEIVDFWLSSDKDLNVKTYSKNESWSVPLESINGVVDLVKLNTNNNKSSITVLILNTLYNGGFIDFDDLRNPTKILATEKFKNLDQPISNQPWQNLVIPDDLKIKDEYLSLLNKTISKGLFEVDKDFSFDNTGPNSQAWDSEILKRSIWALFIQTRGGRTLIKEEDQANYMQMSKDNPYFQSLPEYAEDDAQPIQDLKRTPRVLSANLEKWESNPDGEQKFNLQTKKRDVRFFTKTFMQEYIIKESTMFGFTSAVIRAKLKDIRDEKYLKELNDEQKIKFKSYLDVNINQHSLIYEVADSLMNRVLDQHTEEYVDRLLDEHDTFTESFLSDIVTKFDEMISSMDLSNKIVKTLLKEFSEQAETVIQRWKISSENPDVESLAINVLQLLPGGDPTLDKSNFKQSNTKVMTIMGYSTSGMYGEILKELMTMALPDLRGRIEAFEVNDVLNNEWALGIGPNTLNLLITESGETSGPLNELRSLWKLNSHVRTMTGRVDAEINFEQGQQFNKSSPFQAFNYVMENFYRSETKTISELLIISTQLAIATYILEDLLNTFPNQKPWKMKITHADIADMKFMLKEMVSYAQEITGYDSNGERVEPTLVRKEILASGTDLGNRIRMPAIVLWVGRILTGLTYFILPFYLFAAPPFVAAGLVLSQFVTALSPFLAVGFGQFALLLLDIVSAWFLGEALTFVMRKLWTKENTLFRSLAPPNVTIEAYAEHVSKTQEMFGNKLFSQAFGILRSMFRSATSKELPAREAHNVDRSGNWIISVFSQAYTNIKNTTISDRQAKNIENNPLPLDRIRIVTRPLVGLLSHPATLLFGGILIWFLEGPIVLYVIGAGLWLSKGLMNQYLAKVANVLRDKKAGAYVLGIGRGYNQDENYNNKYISLGPVLNWKGSITYKDILPIIGGVEDAKQFLVNLKERGYLEDARVNNDDSTKSPYPYYHVTNKFFDHAQDFRDLMLISKEDLIKDEMNILLVGLKALYSIFSDLPGSSDQIMSLKSVDDVIKFFNQLITENKLYSLKSTKLFFTNASTEIVSLYEKSQKEEQSLSEFEHMKLNRFLLDTMLEHWLKPYSFVNHSLIKIDELSKLFEKKKQNKLMEMVDVNTLETLQGVLALKVLLVQAAEVVSTTLVGWGGGLLDLRLAEDNVKTIKLPAWLESLPLFADLSIIRTKKTFYFKFLWWDISQTFPSISIHTTRAPVDYDEKQQEINNMAVHVQGQINNLEKEYIPLITPEVDQENSMNIDIVLDKVNKSKETVGGIQIGDSFIPIEVNSETNQPEIMIDFEHPAFIPTDTLTPFMYEFNVIPQATMPAIYQLYGLNFNETEAYKTVQQDQNESSPPQDRNDSAIPIIGSSRGELEQDYVGV